MILWTVTVEEVMMLREVSPAAVASRDEGAMQVTGRTIAQTRRDEANDAQAGRPGTWKNPRAVIPR